MTAKVRFTNGRPAVGASLTGLNTAPIPDFVETFVDDGVTDMKKLMRTLVAVDFRGILIADHVPGMVGGKTGWAYSMGYIRALYDMARDEKAGKRG